MKRQQITFDTPMPKPLSDASDRNTSGSTNHESAPPKTVDTPSPKLPAGSEPGFEASSSVPEFAGVLPKPSFSFSSMVQAKTSHSPQRLSSLKALEDLYGTPPAKSVISAIHNLGRSLPLSNCRFDLHTAATLGVFRSELQAAGGIDEDDRTIRYLLTEDYRLVFAKEGSFPPHFMLTGETSKPSSSRCRCAGNIVFSPDFSSIALINNKSGDFKPEDVLLSPVFAILVVLHENNIIKLPEVLTVEHQRNGMERYEISLNLLTAYVHEKFDPQTLQTMLEVNKAGEKRTVEYVATARKTSRVRAVAFGLSGMPSPAPTPARSGKSLSGIFEDFSAAADDYDDEEEQAVDRALMGGSVGGAVSSFGFGNPRSLFNSRDQGSPPTQPAATALVKRKCAEPNASRKARRPLSLFSSSAPAKKRKDIESSDYAADKAKAQESKAGYYDSVTFGS